MSDVGEFCPISVDDYVPLEEQPDIGAVPMLQWIEISSLVVDKSYQRDIALIGRKNVRKIAQSFKWNKFGSVIASPVAGGNFAIVDGQHRTTAALLIGIKQVPCQVIIASRAEQAAAFKAINGNVTKMTSLQIHAAALAAGDPTALAVADICARTEVTILRSVWSTQEAKPGQTMAVATIEKCLQVFGRDVLVTALQCVTQTTNCETPRLLNSHVIRALCEFLRSAPDLVDRGEALLNAFDHIEIAAHYETALSQKKTGGVTIASVMAGSLLAACRAALAEAA